MSRRIDSKLIIRNIRDNITNKMISPTYVITGIGINIRKTTFNIHRFLKDLR